MLWITSKSLIAAAVVVAIPKALGVESVLAGLRTQLDDDDRLLAAACDLFDALHAAFAAAESAGGQDDRP